MSHIRLVVSDLFPGDAIGNFVLAARDALLGAGLQTSLYAERRAEGLAGVAPYADFFVQARPEDVLFYQLSNYDPAWPELMAAPCRRAVYYHNITPGEFFAPYSPETARLLAAGREARPLIASAHLALANSRYSLAEIEPFLPPATPRAVFPPFLPAQMWRPNPIEANPVGANPIKAASQPYLLCLGRLAPHKRLEDALNIFSRLRRLRPDLRLLLVGSGFEPYGAHIRALVEADPALAVAFLGHLPAEDVQVLLRGAAGLLHASRHEGFCMPLLEAMWAGVPVFAHRQTAALETLGGTGLTFDSERPDEAAELIAGALRAREPGALAAQKRRAEAWLALADEGRLIRLLTGEGGTD